MTLRHVVPDQIIYAARSFCDFDGPGRRELLANHFSREGACRRFQRIVANCGGTGSGTAPRGTGGTCSSRAFDRRRSSGPAADAWRSSAWVFLRFSATLSGGFGSGLRHAHTALATSPEPGGRAGPTSCYGCPRIGGLTPRRTLRGFLPWLRLAPFDVVDDESLGARDQAARRD